MAAKQEWCKSVDVLMHKLNAIRNDIWVSETEETWDAIARSISALTVLCGSGGCDFPEEIISTMREFSRPITKAMNSERTRLSGAAIDLIGVVASGLGIAFDPLVHLFFPALLVLCSRTNKVIITRARTCIFTIIETTQLPSILPYFLQSVKDKSSSLRLMVAEGALASINGFNPPDLEKDARAREIEAIIRATATDANANVRKVGKKIFEAYKLLLPNRVDKFTAPLSPTTKKYLNVKSSGPERPSHTSTLPHSLQPSEPARAIPQTELNPSSSTSASDLGPSSLSQHKPLYHAQHKSTSVIATAVSSQITERAIPAKHLQIGPLPPKKTNIAPIRLAQQSIHTSAPRSRSTIDDSKQATSSSSKGQPSRYGATNQTTMSSEGTACQILTSAKPELARRSYLTTASRSAHLPHRSVIVSTIDRRLGQSATAERPAPKHLSGVAERNTATTMARRVPVPVNVPEEGEPEMGKTTRPTLRIGRSHPSTISARPVLSKMPPADSQSGLPEPVVTKLPQHRGNVNGAQKITKKAAAASMMAPRDVTSGLIARPSGNDSKIRSITQPTLSQLSRVRAPVERKRHGSTITKPISGRAAPRKIDISNVSSAGTGTRTQNTVVVSPSVVPETVTKEVQSSLMDLIHNASAPALVPLPPSPVLDDSGNHIHDESHWKTNDSNDRDRCDSTEPNVVATAGGEMTATTEGVSEIQGVCTENIPSSVPNNIFDNDSDIVPSSLESMTLNRPGEVDLNGKNCSPVSCPETSSPGPVTPDLQQCRNSVLDIQNSINKTPISSLLSSIHQGFLFTPSSPLSPPQSRLCRVSPIEEDTEDWPNPPPWHSGSSEANQENTTLLAESSDNKQRKDKTTHPIASTGMDGPFVTLDGAKTRQALSDVEVNQ